MMRSHTGTGAAAAYFPLAAQWDNLAITKAVNFAAPQASNSTATLRPLVTITNPANGSAPYFNGLGKRVFLIGASCGAGFGWHDLQRPIFRRDE